MMRAPQSYKLTVAGLIAGLGVEDIACRHGLDVSLIRRHVEAMRRNGVLASIIRQARAA